MTFLNFNNTTLKSSTSKEPQVHFFSNFFCGRPIDYLLMKFRLKYT